MRPSYIRHVTLNSGHRRDSRRSEISARAIEACSDLIARLRSDGIARLPHPDGYMIAGIAGARTRPEQIFADSLAAAGVQAPIGRCLTTIVTRCDSQMQPMGRPLVMIAVAGHSRCGAAVWGNLSAMAAHLGLPTQASRVQPPAPWCAALLLPGIADDPQAAEWLGDFERCLAWSWVLATHTPETEIWDELEEHACAPRGPARPIVDDDV